MNHSSHSPANSRPGSLSHTTLTNSYHSNHYGSVKVEDDHYGSSNHHNHNGQSNHYHTTLPPFAHTVPEAGDIDSWHAHTYSAERGGQSIPRLLLSSHPDQLVTAFDLPLCRTIDSSTFY
ncbi:hypothetical protein J3R83DRAFT_14017 [Lanmaoa asiatica]|nr:hypothetical protein J3R83DRAFT_14017 [Lanmaoa asiatica]